jgi:hypothetical protein
VLLVMRDRGHPRNQNSGTVLRNLEIANALDALIVQRNGRRCVVRKVG